MVFKRRDARSWGRTVTEWFWPRGGWGRAVQYMQYRLRRLPGTPEQIARGVFAGAFTVFTPFFGVHFVVAAILARIMQGNMLAALLATFIGNPLTYVPIAAISLGLGRWMLGLPPLRGSDHNLRDSISDAFGDLWHNFKAIFTAEQTRWADLIVFYNDVFFPWMVGSIVPGIICGLVSYALSVPVIRAYQKRRSGRLRKKMTKLERQAGAAGAKR